MLHREKYDENNEICQKPITRHVTAGTTSLYLFVYLKHVPGPKALSEGGYTKKHRKSKPPEQGLTDILRSVNFDTHQLKLKKKLTKRKIHVDKLQKITAKVLHSSVEKLNQWRHKVCSNVCVQKKSERITISLVHNEHVTDVKEIECKQEIGHTWKIYQTVQNLLPSERNKMTPLIIRATGKMLVKEMAKCFLKTVCAALKWTKEWICR